MDIDREAILQAFQVESEEHLSAMEEALVALETHPEDEGLLQTIFRMAHTIKGTASCLGLQAVTEVAHVLEHALEGLRKHTLSVTSELVTLLLRAVYVLGQ